MNEVSFEKSSCVILIVDDVKENLGILRATLEPQGYKLLFANSGEKALQVIKNSPPDLVLLDVMMPGINGFETCRQLKKNRATKDIPVIFITAKNEESDLINGFDVGGIDYITKPFRHSEVCARVETHLQLYIFRRTLKELLEKTLTGSLSVLTEVLTFFDPSLFGRSLKVKEMIKKFHQRVGLEKVWEMEVAALVARIGCVTLPKDLLEKERFKATLSNEEKKSIACIPEASANFIENIPRLRSVARIVLYLNKNYNGSGFPDDSIKEKKIPLGSRLLKIFFDLAQIEEEGTRRDKALDLMLERNGIYDPEALNKVDEIFRWDPKSNVKK
jgi:putative two-component system response regulator